MLDDRECELCPETEGLFYDEDGRLLCSDCLFEEHCRQLDEEDQPQ